MEYNSKYTGAQVEALLDRAGAAPQTYDIGWLMNLFSATENNVTLTAEQFNEVKAAADAHKIFVGYGQVFSSSAYSYGDSTYIILTQSSANYVSIYSVSSLNGTYKVSVTDNQIITQNDLTATPKPPMSRKRHLS